MSVLNLMSLNSFRILNSFTNLVSIKDFFGNVLSFLLNLLIFFLVLGIIVGIHEFGHFIFAKKAKILTREFAIGMGPIVYSKRKGETLYSLRALPIGGFCSIAGETVEDDLLKDVKTVDLVIKNGIVEEIKPNCGEYNVISYDLIDLDQSNNLFIEVQINEEVKLYPVSNTAFITTNKMSLQIAPFNRTLNSKKKTQRAMVMFGGPLMNFLLAILAFLILGFIVGKPNLGENLVGEVSAQYPIAEVLESGDRITELTTVTLGTKKINSWDDISAYLDDYEKQYLSEEITITILKPDNTVKVSSVSLFFAINNCGFGSDFDYNKNGQTKVGIVNEINEIASNVELKQDDIIIGIYNFNTNEIVNPTWGQVRKVFDNFVGGSSVEEENYIYLRVLRDNQEKVIKLKPFSRDLILSQTTFGGEKIQLTDSIIGISPSYKFDFFYSFGFAVKRTGQSFTVVFDTLRLLFNGTVSVKNLSGPVGIYSITSMARENGLTYVLSIIGLLSVNVGLLNLFPIPALDGGRLLFLGYEAVTKKKPNPKVETILIAVTMVLLLGLMIFVTFGDIARIIRG